VDPRLASKLERMYPSCTHREIEELASSIEGEKYWRAQGGFIFAVALSRARLLKGSSWIAQTTGLGRVVVPRALRPLCRKGRVLLLSAGDPPTALLAIGWPAFLWAMRKDEVQRLVGGAVQGKLKGYVGVPGLKEYLAHAGGEALAGPSGIGPETPGSPRPR
jgi:hypothetical protein